MRRLKNIVLVVLLTVVTSCERKNSKRKLIFSHSIIHKKTNSTYIKNERYGNENIYDIYESLKNEIIEDTLIKLPFKKGEKQKMNFTHFKDYFENSTCYLNYSKLTLENNIIIEFINDQERILINHKPVSIKKMYSGMYMKKSEIYFDYDGAEIYRLSDKKYVIVGQSGRWCGLANQFDIYQVFDIEKNELMIFSYKDGLCEK